MTVLRVISEPGRLDAGTRERFAEALTATVLHVEVGSDNPVARTGIMVLFDEVPKDRWAVGGRLDDKYVSKGGRLLILAQAMQGVWTEERRKALIEGFSQAVCSTLGLDASPRTLGSTWVLFHEIPDGSWGAFGSAISIRALIEPAGFGAAQREDIERTVRGKPGA